MQTKTNTSLISSQKNTILRSGYTSFHEIQIHNMRLDVIMGRAVSCEWCLIFFLILVRDEILQSLLSCDIIPEKKLLLLQVIQTSIAILLFFIPHRLFMVIVVLMMLELAKR